MQKPVRRTARVLVKKGEPTEYGQQWTPGKTITCEVTGEMDDHSKVWTDIEDGEQYCLMRMLGKYNFVHI